ncbi:VOC family protein [Stakelama sediminis]|uniref:Catechol 2,3-dioxygenase-like lactoylglutathione lyase family enzyme n=1 Tax=Stakelama sediminis TaxID=463200 RepID=A0A840YW51_9SPHN|nr:VOC family protein [Stakelama sediminis]MBB5717863.1 catechol 2,3-dioxygenase-like lactoylglutathione lyase family enzyme [Stakelama sediminis]
MLDHIGLTVSDHAASRGFYDAVLTAIGIDRVLEVTAEQTGAHAHTGYGKDGKPFFWIGGGATVSGPIHAAFTVESRAHVDAFHAAGLAAGGTDNGAPGLRPYYHPDYYGAFILDPDGNNIEAVCHQPA